MLKFFDDEIRQLSINENAIPSNIEISRLSNPGEFYKLFVTDEVIESILEETALHNEWRNINCSKQKVKKINEDEIRAVIGIILYMGIIKLPNRKMYWSSKPRVDFIASSMSINRFDEIDSLLHFDNNNNLPGRNSPLYKKCFKIQPLINHFRENFLL